MAKIIIDARELTTSTGRYVERLLNYLQKIDHTNKYFVLLKPKDFEDWKPFNKNFIKVESPFKEFTWSEQIDLWRQIKKLKADLVHFTMVQQPIFYRGKVVTTMHDLTTTKFRNPSKNWLIFTFKRWVYRLVNKVVARKSKFILTPTEFIKDAVARYAKINSRKIAVTHEAADKIEEASKPIDELIDKKFILYVGRALPHKNLDRLISAFSKLQADHPDLHLVLAGKRSILYTKLALKVKAKGIQNVIFTGFVDEGQLRWLYENTVAYVFPSLSEGFGLPGLEAMVHGCPVVSSNATSLPEVYGDVVEYFDPGNVDEMAEAINKVIKNESLRNRLIKAGKARAAKYSWENTAKQTLEIYKEALDS